MTHAAWAAGLPNLGHLAFFRGKLSSTEQQLCSLASQRFPTNHPQGLGGEVTTLVTFTSFGQPPEFLPVSWERERSSAAFSDFLTGV